MIRHSTFIVMLAMLAGCSSVMDRRISAHEETWRQLSERDQQRLKSGFLLDGDTEEMVRIAYGPPDKMLTVAGKNGEARTVWVYEILQYVSSAPGLDPDTINHLKMPSDEKRVTFQNGLVVNRADRFLVDRANNPAEIHRKIEAFRAKYNLPTTFRLRDPVQIEEFRAIFGRAPATYN